MAKSSPSIWRYVFGKCQIDGEDFVNFCGLLGKYELYYTYVSYNNGQIVSEGIFCVFKSPKKQIKIMISALASKMDQIKK